MFDPILFFLSKAVAIVYANMVLMVLGQPRQAKNIELSMHLITLSIYEYGFDDCR